MFEFDKICKAYEELDPATYAALLIEKSAKVLPVLEGITIDGLDGATIFATFIIASIAADGKVDEAEYALMEPLLKDFFGPEFNYAVCKELVRGMKKESKEIKNVADEMVDILGLLSTELKADIITICLLICSVDGKVDFKEKQWIKQLIR